MPKTILYHGTTIENYKEISQNGFGCDSVLWSNASDYNYTYFWNPSALMESEELDDMESAHYMAKQRASESALITAALQKSKAEHIIVLAVLVDNDYVMGDDSCENMESMGAVQVENENLSPNMIKNVYFSNFVATLSLFYIVGLIDNQFIELWDYLSQTEINAMEILKKSNSSMLDDEFYYPEVFEDNNYHAQLIN